MIEFLLLKMGVYLKKRYEDFKVILFFFFILLTIIFLFFVFIFNSKISIYKIFSGVVFDDECILFVLNDKELKLFQKNKVLFIESEEIRFDILKIESDIVYKEDIKYHQVYIKVDISDMYKVGDVLGVSIKEKRVKSYEIFKIIWKGGYDEEDK